MFGGEKFGDVLRRDEVSEVAGEREARLDVMPAIGEAQGFVVARAGGGVFPSVGKAGAVEEKAVSAQQLIGAHDGGFLGDAERAEQGQVGNAGFLEQLAPGAGEGGFTGFQSAAGELDGRVGKVEVREEEELCPSGRERAADDESAYLVDDVHGGDL